MRPRLLDAFCCQGGCSMGYSRAGFDVEGVDIVPQPRYPFRFHQGDALEFIEKHGHEYDAIHASPTCQRKARVTAWRGNREDHPNTLTPTLELLRGMGVPYVVENVTEAADELRTDFLLCGTQFGLNIRRHRIFERGYWDGYQLLPPCTCASSDLVPFEHKNERAFADAMGCTWMSSMGGRQAIPPAYTEWIGCQLITHLESLEVA
jgi:DNA (cytosine-5)-methyltransferase 1